MYELQIEYLSNKIGKVLTQLKSLEPSRAKRGLVDGLGSVIKSITGNLDYWDAVKFNDAIKTLQDSDNKIVSEFNNHISLSKEWMSQHSDVLTQLIENQNKVNATIELILDRDAYREDSLIKYAKFAQLLEIIGENLEDLTTELTKIENNLAFIRASTTHHSMIDVEVLKSMIDKLRNIYDGDQILNLEVRDYYEIIKPGSFYIEKQIVIIFKFPIVSKDIYNLYRLSIVPNKDHQVLIPSYPFLATSGTLFMYMEAECPKLNNWYLCEKSTTHQDQSKSDCIQHLISNQALEESCQFTTVTLTKAAMEQLDDKHYILSFPTPTKVQSTCGREDSNVLEGSYLATVPVNCYIRTKEFTVTNDNDEIKGQPLKLMKIPYNVEKQAASSSHIRLNSVNLQRLHKIDDKILLEDPLRINQTQPNTIYHTTIPFYIVLLCAVALAATLIVRHYHLKTCNKDAATIPNPKHHTYEDPENETKHQPQRNLPATFSLNVLK